MDASCANRKVLKPSFEEVDRWSARTGLLSCHHASGVVQAGLFELAMATGRADNAKCWSRSDLMASTFKSSSKGGPAWPHVFARVTAGCDDGRVLESRLIEEFGRAGEHAKLPNGCQSTTTFLLYFIEKPKQRLSTCMRDVGFLVI